MNGILREGKEGSSEKGNWHSDAEKNNNNII